MQKSRYLIFFIAIILSFCGNKKTNHHPEFFRLIDHLKAEDVVTSPLKELPDRDTDYKKYYPQCSVPLEDFGIEQNPFKLVRKIQLKDQEFDVLCAPSESEYSFPVRLPENPAFEFGIGLLDNRSPEGHGKSAQHNAAGAAFVVALESKGMQKILFQKYIDLSSTQKTGLVSHHKINLPPIKEDVRLSLKTTGDPKAFAFWFNPVVYNRNPDNINIILISIDTLRADHLGCYGYERNTSPNIDELASDSAVFLNTYSLSPWTLSSHVSMMTSLVEAHHQVSREFEKINPSLVTLADMLRKSGFYCSAVTGGGYVSYLYGFSQGFNQYIQQNEGIRKNLSAAWTFKQASNWINENKDKNFFLFIHTYQPHTPYSCPKPYNTMFLDKDAKWHYIDYYSHLGGAEGIFNPHSEKEKKNIIDLYDSEIRYTDEKLIKPLIQEIKDLGIYQKTMLVFTGDHGEEFYEHGGWFHGHSLYNEVLKVPLIIKFPKSKFAGRNIQNIVRLTDIMPTILDEINFETDGLKLDGKSLVPVIKGKEKKERVVVAYKAENVFGSHLPEKYAISSGRYKLILNKEMTEKDISFFTSIPPFRGEFELYDLYADPFEKNNVAEKMPTVVSQMLEEMELIYAKAEKREVYKVRIEGDVRERLKSLGYIHPP